MNYKTFSIVLAAIIVGSVALGTALALVTNNGNGTWSFTYTVTDAQATHIADAFTTQYLREYQAAQRHGNITKAGFVDAKVKGYIQGVVSAYDKAEQLKTLPPITPIPLD